MLPEREKGYHEGMAPKKGFNCPFEILNQIPKEELPAERAPSLSAQEISFEEVMQGVKRLLGREKIYWRLTPKRSPSRPKETLDLNELLRIRVRETSEYVEELVRGFQRELFEALHAGRISVSGVLNLHRLRVAEAEVAFEEFMRESLIKGARCVLIIHGRGRSSRGEPVLKNKVHEWLRRGPFRKHVIGFCTARQCDGGLGATYVLLSPYPLRKKVSAKR